MKRILQATSLALFLALAAGTQPAAASDSLSRLPAGLQVKDDGPRTYRFTCDYVNLDTKGNTTGMKQHVVGEYTRGLPDGKARWNGVAVNGQKREFMEGFTYRLADTGNSLKAEFFPGFPPMAFQERNLVWDTVMLEGFAENYFDKLSLNVPYHVAPATFPLAGAGQFENKDLTLTWIGVSKRNGQKCVLIDYAAFLNKVNIKFTSMELVARSHYWGQIWVSLATKQIEYATLYEDVLGEMKIEAQPKPMIVNVFRIGAFERVVP
jgi:hypothetical protein